MKRGLHTCFRADGSRKNVFTTKRLAKRFIRRGGIHPVRRSDVSVYPCASCTGFHIGHKLTAKEHP